MRVQPECNRVKKSQKDVQNDEIEGLDSRTVNPVWPLNRTVNPWSVGTIMETMANRYVILSFMHALGVSMVQLHIMFNSYSKILWCLSKYNHMGNEFRILFCRFHHSWNLSVAHKSLNCVVSSKLIKDSKLCLCVCSFFNLSSFIFIGSDRTKASFQYNFVNAQPFIGSL